ncbi:P-loop containing nucleoside triphosphate hydrolase protein [Suillus clintonianus]|uniref:P-loop containing nucleoside triphosphate hydrolase protein n=1 Tax=Suillus clintonianus TaxID=1904413 RepID=UPI001B881850|nr:P-loop containing nucleoside triphosphate hydrolase protein [Suillus clintonianus]KAG2151417.1 P-loop containing nucleoside triphosphate hydrolase protein [Suillus clintonianus]
MDSKRERHNSKARRSTAGSRKKGKSRNKSNGVVPTAEAPDPNAAILEYKSLEDKERDRKERLVRELAAQSDSKVSRQKRKRLEKYVEKKLLKEERLVIFEKLAQTQAQTSSLDLQSSSTLGTGATSTARERLEKLEDKEVRRAIEGQPNKRRRRHNDFTVHEHGDGEDESDAMDGVDFEIVDQTPEQHDEHEDLVTTEFLSDPPAASTVSQPASLSTFAVGGALKRNPDGSVVAPLVVNKKSEKSRMRASFPSWKRRVPPKGVSEQESDSSFDSSDSAYDTDEEQRNEGREMGISAEGSDEEEERPLPAKKRLGFKDWAVKQLNTAKGHDTTEGTPPSLEIEHPTAPPPKKRKTMSSQSNSMRGPLGEDLKLPSTSFAERMTKTQETFSKSSSKSIKSVSVIRPLDIQESRMQLPIIAEEQPIMETIMLNPVVIICGETGSGKTTQIPQFLYEAGFGDPTGVNSGMIGVTQPRRVAAMSMASRVARELSLTSSRVSYQIRYDATVSPSTTIKFMTDGVLLRELATDFLLSKYSVIIIDEAHERSMNTDILIGVLSRVIKLREQMWKEGTEGTRPLRLIIMSATLRVGDFAENQALFSSPPPVVNVDARQHPVTVHFNRRTSTDYVREAVKKAAKIHARLPPGGILIFLTGQNEIQGVCKKLEARYGRRALEARKKRRQVVQASSIFAESITSEVPFPVAPVHADIEAEDIEFGVQEQELALDVDGDLAEEDPEGLDSDDEDGVNTELGIDVEECDVPMQVVPLYSLLSSEKQMRVFDTPPAGYRLVVVSTNVAETSLTIPNIRYVIDCGRAKERHYDMASGIQSFRVSWISKASAAQRAGRAGRTGPGHCYRLYSSALYEHYFESFSQPEILRTPIEGVVLQMKSMNIDAVVNFPFPTPPDRQVLKKAETVLTRLGALSSAPLVSQAGVSMSTIGGQVTPLGKAMSFFPLSPRFARMLVGSQQHGCLPYVISIVAAMSVGDPFLREEGLDADSESDADDEGLGHIKSASIKAKEARRTRRRAFFESQQVHGSLSNFNSDIFRLLSVVGAYEYSGGGHQFCKAHFVRPKAMEEIHKLRAQLSSIAQANFQNAEVGFDKNIRPPNDIQLKAIRQLLAAAFIDQVAVRKDLIQNNSSGSQFSTAKGVPYAAVGVSGDVFIHPMSVLANRPPPDYLVFSEVVQTSRTWIKGLTVINPAWLSSLGKQSMCTFSKPSRNNAGVMMSIPRFGPDQWELPPVKV